MRPPNATQFGKSTMGVVGVLWGFVGVHVPSPHGDGPGRPCGRRTWHLFGVGAPLALIKIVSPLRSQRTQRKRLTVRSRHLGSRIAHYNRPRNPGKARRGINTTYSQFPRAPALKGAACYLVCGSAGARNNRHSRSGDCWVAQTGVDLGTSLSGALPLISPYAITFTDALQ